jgi:hypothetical protein
MATLDMTLTLQQSTAEIEQLISKALKAKVDNFMRKAAKRVEQKLRKFLRVLFTATDVVRDLLSRGQLLGELGLNAPVRQVKTIIEQWVNNFKVSFVDYSIAKRFGSFKIQAIQDDWRDVIALSDAFLMTGAGEFLPWLHWLLFEGSKVIIGDYRFFEESGRGRTGHGVMVKNGEWRVPSWAQGTRNDNFITRALREAEGALKSIIIQEMKKV